VGETLMISLNIGTVTELISEYTSPNSVLHAEYKSVPKSFRGLIR